jgi:sec-independent protein translocase protein TatB
MFDIGGSELLVIAVVALLVVGPKELPALLRTIGRVIGAVKRQAQEFREQFNEAIRDSEFEDLKNSVNELKSEATSGLHEITKDIEKEVDDAKSVGADLSREIEDSTKEDHDLDWLEEYEREADAGAGPGKQVAADTVTTATPADPTTPAEDAGSGGDAKPAQTADAGDQPPKKAAGAAT